MSHWIRSLGLSSALALPGLSAVPVPKVVGIHGGESPGNAAALAVDGNWQTFWASNRREQTDGPRGLDLDLGAEADVQGFLYLPPPYVSNGRMTRYKFFVSQDGQQWGAPAAEGKFEMSPAGFWPDVKEKFATVRLPKAVHGRYVRLETADPDIRGRASTAIAEFVPITNLDDYPFKETTLALLKGTCMAPSIHLTYRLPSNLQAFYSEVKVEQSAPGSYFMVIGWDGGYFGLQDQGGRKVAIFSVWDAHAGDNPGAVPEEHRVKALYQGEGVEVKRFGGEGTGGQSFFPFDWQVGQTYRLAVLASGDDKATAYTGYLETAPGTWKKLVTFATPRPHGGLNGVHHFVEDFQRDFNSFKQIRSAQFLNAWGYSATDWREPSRRGLAFDGQGRERDLSRTNPPGWIRASRARFTVDGNPNRNIDAAPVENGCRLISGGDTKNQTTPAMGPVTLAVTGEPPANLPAELLEQIQPKAKAGVSMTDTTAGGK